MKTKQPNVEFFNNIEFLIMCKNMITASHKIGGCLVRQEGFITASLETYLDFWFNCLPVSTDRKCRPICAISEKVCLVRNDEGAIIEAELNVPLYTVVSCFKECISRNQAAHDIPSLSQVILNLGKKIGQGEISQTDLIGWQQYYLPAKVSVLELVNNKLEEENQRLNVLVADSEGALIRELPKYAPLFKAKETQFIANVIACRSKIDSYREFISHQRVCGMKQPDCDTNVVFLRKMAKEAIRFNESQLRNMTRHVYRDIPERITSLPISTINEICGTDLKIIE